MTTTRLDIPSSTIFRVILIGFGFWFLYYIRDVIVMLLAAVVVAAALEPIANRLQGYRIPRAVTVAGIYIALIALVSLVVTLIIPPLTEQIGRLAVTLPNAVENFIPARAALQESLTRLGNQLTNISFNVLQQTRNVFSGIFSFLLVFVIAFYLVIERDALKKAFRLITPREHIEYVERIIDRSQYKIGRWLLGQLGLAATMGIIVGVGLWLLGLRDYALVLGLLVAVFEIVPYIGPIMAAIPGVVLGLSQSVIMGIVVLVFYVLAQQLENNVLVPNIMKKATGLNPLVTLIAVLLGARLAGVVGVILAVPIATIISVFLTDFFTTPAEEELAG